MENTFIEMLRQRHQEAAKRLQLAQAKLQAAQADFNLAAQQNNSWQVAVTAEIQRVQQDAAAQEAEQRSIDVHPAAETPKPTVASALPPSTSTPPPPEINKTELVRDVLRQHPNGVTPVDISKELKNQVTVAYVHSVLYRLKDREEIGRKRGGKYYLKQQPQPGHTEEPIEQDGAIVEH
jgi:hypothetical protein